jgi:hypothetical protein
MKIRVDSICSTIDARAGYLVFFANKSETTEIGIPYKNKHGVTYNKIHGRLDNIKLLGDEEKIDKRKLITTNEMTATEIFFIITTAFHLL